MRVITGSPGCGKSAILARLVTLSDRNYRAMAPSESLFNSSIPTVDSIDVAINARHKTLEKITQLISHGVGLDTSDPGDLTYKLAALPSNRLVIVVDGLDEAGVASSTGSGRRSEPQVI